MANQRRSIAEFLHLAGAQAVTVTDGLKRDMPIEQLVPGHNQPRRHFDAAELEAMAATIRTLGIIQPIIVRPLSANALEQYAIVAGERRWRAAQLANMTTVPVIIRHLDERRLLLYSLAENVARSDLNPLELARGYQSVVREQGLSQTELAEAIGQNVKTVNRLLQLLKLPDVIQHFIEQRQLSAKHGEVLSGLAKPRQIELARQAVENEWTVRQLERQITKSANASHNRPLLEATNPPLDQEQRLWSEQLGTAVKLRQGKSGTICITISVSSLDEYQGIRERLGIS